MKLRSILCGVLAIAAAVACKPDDVVETPKLDVDKTAVSVTAEAGQATFNVTTNQDWTASADADWVSVNPNNGKASDKAVAVTVTADDNDTEAERTATVTVKAGTLSKTVKVTQAAKAATPEPPVDEPEYTVTELYMLGSACDTGWSLDEMQAFANDGGIFTWTGNLNSEGEFRFPLQKVSGQWWPCLMISEDGTSLVYGTSDDEKVIYHVPETGNYTITINAKDVAAMTVDVAYNGPLTEAPEVSWGLMGCFVDNQWGTDIPMAKEGEWIVAKNAQFTELTFKIRGNASWNDKHNIGYAPGTEKGLVNAKLAVVTAEYSKANLGDDCKDIRLNGPAGTYDVYFSFENLEVYVMEAGYKPGEREPIQAEPQEVTYTVVGTLNNINWNNSAPEGLMAKDGNYYVAKNVPFVTAATLYGGADQIEFKIVETGTWDGYGVAAETAAALANAEIAVVAGGNNIPVTAAEGAYDVYFDKENGKVWVMEPGYKPGEKDPVTPPEEPQPTDPVTTGVIWENDGTVGAAAWAGSPYRFSIEGGDALNECVAEIPAAIWEGMKIAPFSVNIQPAPEATWWQIRILDGWWTNNDESGASDINPQYAGLINNGDGTYTFEVNLASNPDLLTLMDTQHLLFAGDGFIINKIYFSDGSSQQPGDDTFDGEMLTQFYYAAEQYDQYKQAIVMAATAGVSTDPTTYQTTGTGKILNLTLHAEKSDAGVYIPVGTYTAGPDTNTPFTWQVTGGMPEYNAYWGTYITDIVDGQASIVELTEGTVEVEYADGNYTITLTSGDIKLRYTGPIAQLAAPAN